MLAILPVRPETPVAPVRGREPFHEPRPDPWWLPAVPRLRRPKDLPPGHADGYQFAAPVVRVPAYLRWLVDELAAAGVGFRHRAVADLAAVPADVVVNAAGLGARELAADPTVTGIRGQVVRVADPGLARWTLDEDHPDGLVCVGPARHRRGPRRDRAGRRRAARPGPGRDGRV